MQNNTPSIQQFKQAQSTIQSIITQYNTKLDTSKGSVIRQLLVRPYAYIYAYINKFINNWLNRTSVNYLKNTTDTQDQIADLVASNYFVTRNQGNYASGQLLVSLYNTPSIIPANTKFTIDGKSFRCQYTYLIGGQSLNDQDIKSIQPYVVDKLFKAIIPVISQEPGSIQIVQDTPAQADNLINYLQSIKVFSAISGGSSVQTNAQMMLRCQNKCSSTLGSQRAIANSLFEAPVNVVSCNSIGTMQPGQLRSRYNNLFIPVAGSVDSYVKTRNKPAKKVIAVDSSQLIYNTQLSQYSFQLDLEQVSGFYNIEQVRLYSNDTLVGSISIQDYICTKASIQYLSKDPNIDAACARLSYKQKAKIHIASEPLQNPKVIAQITYMPGISSLQSYISGDDKPFLGQDILIKAAIPVKLRLACQLHSLQVISQSLISQIKQSIVSIINSTPIGKCYINMADIQYKIQLKYPQIQLRLPYQLHCSILTSQGLQYPIYSNSGVISLDPNECAYFWNVQGYFIYTDIQFIDIQVV